VEVINTTLITLINLIIVLLSNPNDSNYFSNPYIQSFESLDADGDGFLTVGQLHQALTLPTDVIRNEVEVRVTRVVWLL
jgi:Ca2+-binding EF-hand superfamily protein